ncbi:MAG: tRNA (adenosine(37)-N6)-dimethylallyltransferase MiaA [Bacteroidales bacterium]|nr:tRNA (adenosine(37)-N6)-dimethylallyltransferase MiaA [Bacteroidales bacterium]
MDRQHIVILGPTATGKTRLAALVAKGIGGEIISADSRQVYRGMDLGTGKDILDYVVDGKAIPFHLINIVDAGSQYSIFDYQRDFAEAANGIQARNHTIIICGGSGMYLESALGLYHLVETPADERFRKEAEELPDEVLLHMLASLRPLHNTTDTTDRKRLIRAIEIARAETAGGQKNTKTPISPVNTDNSVVFGIRFPRSIIRQRITERLELRIKEGMLNEVESLLNSGIKPEDLIYYGLEYKYLTLHLTGKISADEMFSLLNTAIHQFAKRQMTWFRRMEKKGIRIHWLDGSNGAEKNATGIIRMVSKQ